MKKRLCVFLFVIIGVYTFASQYFNAKLSNGIVVDARSSGDSGICTLQLIIEGGNAVYSENEINFESFVLEMMKRGGKKYPYNDLRMKEYECLTMLDGVAAYDYSTFGFTCLKEDFFTMLDVAEDVFFDPLFLDEDFKVVSNITMQKLVAAEADPSGRLLNLMRDTIYVNHTYDRRKNLTLLTMSQLSQDKIIACHKKMLDSSRLHFILAGDISSSDFKKIKSRLDKRFGKLESKNYKKSDISKANFSIIPKSNSAVIETAGESAYIAAVYPCPSRLDNDYIAFVIAGNIIEDLCYNTVREKYGATYSSFCNVLGGKQMVGFLELYKTKIDKNIQNYIKEALNNFPIGEKLSSMVEAKKNIYINTLFNSAVTSEGTATQLVVATEYLDNIRAYETRMEKIRAVTTKDVQAAFNKYFNIDNFAWFIVTDESNKKAFSF